MNTDILVILAAGSSTRMCRSLGKTSVSRLTKCMIQVGPEGKPFLHYLLVNAAAAGFREIICVTARGDVSVMDHFGNFFQNLVLNYVEQLPSPGTDKPAGTADALLQVLRFRKDLSSKSFCVCNSDNLYSAGTLEAVRNSSSSSSMPCYRRDGFSYPEDRASRFAVVGVSPEMTVTELLEKPDPCQLASINSEYLSMNLFKLNTDMILPFLERAEPSVRGEKELPSAVNLMVQQFPGCVSAIPVSEHVPDLTSAEDISLLSVSGSFSEYFSEK